MEQFYKPKITLEQGIYEVGKYLEKMLDGTLPVV
jgi:hypothetical protein